MAIWFKIALALNLVYWTIFFYLLSRRRWNFAALAIGVFHMLFAALVSVAPIRSLLDADYIGYGVGLIQVEKRAVVIPATLILGWALASAWIVVGRGKGPWMKLVMIGNIFLALNLGISILLDNPQNWKFQLGEYFTVTGIAGLLVLLCLFTLPFVASAIWAAGRVKSGGTAPPLVSDVAKQRKAPDKDKNNNEYRCAESRV